MATISPKSDNIYDRKVVLTLKSVEGVLIEFTCIPDKNIDDREDVAQYIRLIIAAAQVEDMEKLGSLLQRPVSDLTLEKMEIQ